MSQTVLSPRALQMHGIIEKYLASQLSQKAFCDQEQIAITTFQYWLQHYRKHTHHSAPQAPNPAPFIPLKIKPTAVSAPSACRLEFSNGTRLSFDSVPGVELLLQLMRGL